MKNDALRSKINQFAHGPLLWRFGLGGVGLILLGSLASALAYRGLKGEAYNLLNHFVSELGEVGVAELAWMFNLCLFAGGLCIALFLAGLGARIGRVQGVVMGLLGLACGVSGAMVGVFPMNHLTPHIFWAMSFFNLGLAAMTYFSAIILLGRTGLPKWLAAPGLLAAAALAAFRLLPDGGANEEMAPLAAATISLSEIRPDVWMMAIFEWLAVLSVLAWAAATAFTLRKK